MFTLPRALRASTALAFLIPAFVQAQATINSPVNFSSVAVGSTSSSMTLSFADPANAALTFSLSYGTDFSVGAASCSAGTCSVPVTFQPSYPGIRKGGVYAFNGSTLVSITPVYGIGSGPRLNIGPGVMTTIASQTSPQLTTSRIFGYASRSATQIYVADSNNNQIFLLNPSTGQVTLVAGTGVSGFSGDGGAATSAQLSAPSGLAIDAAGNLLITDSNNHRIRKLDVSTGVITTVAGNGNATFAGDGGLATAASIFSPAAVAVRSNGDIVIVDTRNSRIRIVSIATGVINTLAGNGAFSFGGDNGPAVNAQLNLPTAVAVDSNDNVYIADVNNAVIREVSATSGVITTVAGQGHTPGSSGDGGPATSALLNFPDGIVVDAAGTLYISDTQNNVVRKVTGDSTHTISTIAGRSVAGYTGDGGPALIAGMNGPASMGLDDLGNLYFIDSGNLALRRISFAPAPVSFPFTNVGSPSNSTILVSNEGNLTLNVSAFNFTSNFGFGGGSTCSATPTLAAGQSCNVVLSFTPTTAGATSGTISLSSNSLNNSSASLPIAASQSNGLYFIPVAPCRVVDTRISSNSLTAAGSQDFNIRNSANCPSTIPSGADVRAYSLNVTVVPHGRLNFLSIAPSISGPPPFSTLNSYDGRIKADAVIVGANLTNTNRTVSVYASSATDLVLDINGYFVPQGTSGALAYYALPPCRIADTRLPSNPSGGMLIASTPRNIPMTGQCNLPATAQAYALNFTAIPPSGTDLEYLTVWPAGTSQPIVSTLNDDTGTVTANGAIVPAGSSGNISVFAQAATDLIIDVSGYYAPPTSASGGLGFYTVTTPCRAYDSRYVGSASGNAAPVNGAFSVDVRTACSVPPVAQSYVLNTTVVPTTFLGYLTIWAHGSAQPLQSTLNAYDSAVTSNFAVVPTVDGFVSSYTPAPTALIYDLFGYFAP